MPDVSVGSQVFDIVFHPTHCTAYTALLSGHVKAISYDHQGRSKESFSVSVSQRSCRGISIDGDGSSIYVVGKGKALHTIDTATGKHVQTRAKAHEAPINRVRHLTSWLLSTGDDDGVIKLWDPRQKESIRKYTHHFDYITDFLWLDDKKQLMATSGDGTLSVMDVRSKNTKPIAQSEDQEDELLSIVAIKGSTKFAVGTQIGVLSIFNRSSGWGDCVDRIPGHPHSVDTLCALPESFTGVDATSTILTGSSDGFVRAVQIFPTKLLGVVADHGEWPVERVAIGDGQDFLDLEGEEKITTVANKGDDDDDEKSPDARWWVGSVGHDETLKLTSLRGFFNGENGNSDEGEEDREGASEGDDAGSAEEDEEGAVDSCAYNEAKRSGSEDDGDDSDSDSPAPQTKRKRRKEKNPLMVVKRKKGRNEVEVKGRFFDDL
ncbi:WD40-repeat-containing domain protein [Desarmillaria tabescens]|uniref:WD repeat-containing protein JIP5 n=1 Tax=Armillaria tabescens TaxID=1929756 RepID=A0AA39N815_ARMTA|nr:WD40-repeat-containing domain protein [Desarmillaria tabescens]KAK0460729.1 WD40-repeat-containing domain protein [Desarmillaria tabescens]